MQTITVKIDGHESNTHFLKTHYEEVSEIMARAGYDNDLEGLIAPSGGDIELPEGTAITPSFSKQIRDMIQKCQIPFTLDTEIEGCYGDAPGSANATTTYNKTGMAMQKAVDILDATGQLDTVVKIIDAKRDSEIDPPTNDILAYAIATLSKGWRAERIIDDTDRFAKLSMSADEGGLDLYDRETDEQIQLKPVTTIYSNGESKFENKTQKHLFYQWNGDGTITVTDTQNARDMLGKEADRVGLPTTLLGKSDKRLKLPSEYGRAFRFLHW